MIEQFILSYIGQIIIAFFSSPLFKDSAFVIIFSTIVLNFFAFSFTGGYIFYFAKGFELSTFSGIIVTPFDLITIFPKVLIGILIWFLEQIELFWKRIVSLNSLKVVFESLFRIFILIVFFIVITYIVASTPTLSKPISTFFVKIIDSVALLFIITLYIAILSPKRSKFFILTLFVTLGLYIALIIGVRELLPTINQLPQGETYILEKSQFTLFIEGVLREIFVTVFLLIGLLIPSVFGIVVAETSLKNKMFSLVSDIVLRHPDPLLKKVYQFDDTDISDKPAKSWQERWFRKSTLHISTRPDVYLYQYKQNIKKPPLPLLLIASFKDNLALYYPTQDELDGNTELEYKTGQLILIAKEQVLSYRLSPMRYMIEKKQ